MITKLPPNPGHVEILSDALSHLLLDERRGSPRGGFSNKALSDGSVTIGTRFDLEFAHASMPLSSYQADLDDIGDDFGLGDLEITGWKYLVRFHDALAIAEIRDIDGEPFFGRLIQGDLPLRLRRAELKADDMLGGSGDAFEPRILEVPALYVFALWLHGEGQDYFFSEPMPEGGMAVEDGSLFMTHLKKAKQLRPKAGPNDR